MSLPVPVVPVPAAVPVPMPVPVPADKGPADKGPADCRARAWPQAELTAPLLCYLFFIYSYQTRPEVLLEGAAW